jgi:hypothetical protein
VAATLLAHAEGRSGPTAVLAALAVLARPEALQLVPLLAVTCPPAPRRLAMFGLVSVLLLAPAVWFSLHTVGSVVPATAAAKVEGGLLGWLAGVREPLGRTLLARPAQFLGAWVVWLAGTNWLLPIAIVAGVGTAWRARGGRCTALGLLAGLAVVAHPLGMALLAPYRDPSFQEGRYSTHLLPLVLVLGAVALGRLPARWWGRLAAAYLAVALVSLPAAAERYAWGVQNINAMQVHLGHWVDSHVARGARLALNDIGAIAYVSRRPVVDLMGLVTPDILPYRREGESGVIRYVAERCPDYVIVFPAWFPRMTATDGLLDPVYRVRLDRNEVSGGPEMVVYRLRRCAA